MSTEERQSVKYHVSCLVFR